MAVINLGRSVCKMATSVKVVVVKITIEATARPRDGVVGERRSMRTITSRSLRRVEGIGPVLATSVFQITGKQTGPVTLVNYTIYVHTTVAIRILPAALCIERGHKLRAVPIVLRTTK